MPNYRTLDADVTRIMNRHFTPGRGGQQIRFVTRHHNAGRSTTDQSWNTWQTRQASAHYQIEESGRVGQLVWDRDTAWANGNQLANQQTIAIEHSNTAGADYPMTDATIIGGARWVAALCLYYKLGRPVFGVNIRDHKQFYATACPYHLANGGKYHNRYMAEAVRFYDELSGAVPVPPPVVNAINERAKTAPWLGKRITVGELAAPDGKGRYARFENGHIYWHPDTGAHPIPTHLFEAWANLGWETGHLGYPVNGHTVLPTSGVNPVGDVQAFQRGVLYRKYGQPGFYVTGAIGSRWAKLGYENSVLGWPVSNESAHEGGRVQAFEHGKLYWHPEGVVLVR